MEIAAGNTYLQVYILSFLTAVICFFLFRGMRYRELIIFVPLATTIVAFRSGPDWTRILIISFLFMAFARFRSMISGFYWGKLGIECLIYYFAFLLGFEISFIRLSGTFIYLNVLSPVLTIAWLFLLTRIFAFIGKVRGIVAGVILIFTVILFLVSRSQSEPLFFAENLALILAGVCTLYFITFNSRGGGLDSIQVSLLSFLTGILTITGVTKRVAFLALIFPSFFVILPLFFVASFIFYFYLRENLTDVRRSAGYKIIWRFTNRRAIIGTYFIFFYLSVWFFTLMARIDLRIKLASIVLATIAMVLLFFILTVKMEEKDSHNSSRKARILDILIDNLSKEALIREIDILLDKGKKVFIATPNAVAFVLAHRNNSFREALSKTTFNIPDGAGVIWAADVLESSLQERITGVDFMTSLLEKAALEGKSVYFLGSTQQVLDALVEQLGQSLPGLRIAGFHHGFFSPDENESIVSEINSSRADFLFVAMGMPKQEIWLSENLSRLNISLSMGVGGAFNVHSGIVNRAPRFFQVCGLEWFFRFASEPRRLLKAWQLFYFVLMVLSVRINESHETA